MRKNKTIKKLYNLCKLLDNEQRKRFNDYRVDLCQRKTFLTPLFGFILLLFELLPFPLLLGLLKRKCKFLQEHLIVELYVIFWFILELIILFVISKPTASVNCSAIIITVILVLRLIDIAQSWVKVLLVKSTHGILYPNRLLILTLMNYAELVISFTIIGFLWITDFLYLDNSLAFTLGTLTTIGSNYVPSTTIAWAIYISEIAYGLFFLIIVIVRALTYFEAGQKKD